MASNNTLNITNNSGRDIVVALATSSDETTGSNGVVVANGQLEILKTAGGDTVIKNGTASAVTLNRTYTSAEDGTSEVRDYDLQLCDSTWLYPFAALSVEQQTGNGAAGYAPQTVTDANKTAMTQAALFYQTITAYPDSKLATDYIALIQGTADAVASKADGSPNSAKAVADAMDEHIAQFFQNTQEYQQVRLAHLVAIHNYYNNFPAVWAQYQDEMTYYLYGSDGTTNLFTGVLSLQKSGAFDATKPDGGYTCRFVPAVAPTSTHGNTDVDESKAVTLTYANGLFVDDAVAAKPAIGLRGSFVVQSLFTARPEDNSVLCIVTGTVNGVLCIGFDTAQEHDEQKAATNGLASNTFTTYLDRLTHPKDVWSWVISVTTLIGAVALIAVTAGALYLVRKAIRFKLWEKQKVLSNQRLREIADDQLSKAKMNEETKSVRWIGSDKEVISGDYLEVISKLGLIETETFQMQLQATLLRQSTCIEELQQYKSMMTEVEVDSLNMCLEDVGKSYDDCRKPDISDAELKEACEVFSNTQGWIEGVYTRLLNKITVDSKMLIDEAMSGISRDFGKIPKFREDEEREEAETDPKVKEVTEPFVLE